MIITVTVEHEGDGGLLFSIRTKGASKAVPLEKAFAKRFEKVLMKEYQRLVELRKSFLLKEE